MHGRILSIKAKIEVMGENDITYMCSLRGKLKKDGKTAIVGDIVNFDDSLAINEILPRKNELIRPKVANIDQVLICVSSEPYPDLLLVDKLIISAQAAKITPIVCVTKSDIASLQFATSLKTQFNNIGVEVIIASAKTGENLNEINSILKNKTTAFAGQSGVGKSSLLNALDSNLNLKIGDLTLKINRGKNTTTTTQIYKIKDAFVLDTPGFSALEIDKMTAEKFLMSYPDIYKFASGCKYKSCNHLNKSIDECGVAKALDNGEINKDRFARFISEYSRLAGLRPKYEKVSKEKKKNV